MVILGKLISVCGLFFCICFIFFYATEFRHAISAAIIPFDFECLA